MGKFNTIAAWILLTAYAATVLMSFMAPGQQEALSQVQFLLAPLFALFGSSARFGRAGMLKLLLWALAVSYTLENTSIAWGFPFGLFHHSDAMGAKLIAVPVMVGLLWFAVAYFGWTLAEMLMGSGERRVRILAMPLLASMIGTLFDMAADPLGATVKGVWTWAQPGGYFGIPLSNFAGWVLTLWLILLGFALTVPRPLLQGTARKHSDLQLALLLTLQALQHAVNYLVLPDRVITLKNGATWHTGQIYEANAVIALCLILPLVSAASLRSFTEPSGTT